MAMESRYKTRHGSHRGEFIEPMGRVDRNIKMRMIAFLLGIISCLLLYGCNGEPETLRLEGKSESWTASVEIPYSAKNDDKYIKVTFIFDSADQLFTESDVISFTIGTSAGTIAYSYSKTDGCIKSEYSSDPADLERVVRVSDDTFEVLYDRSIIDTSKKADEQSINLQVLDEKIELLPVK